MEVYEGVIRLHLCANTAHERTRGVRIFSRLFGACNVARAAGVWEGIHEPDLVITHFFTPTDAGAIKRLRRLWRYASLWQIAAKQVAILVEITTPEGSLALVIYAGEWAPAWYRALPLIDRGEFLAEYFEARSDYLARLEVGGRPDA